MSDSRFSPRSCERTREWASLGLDGELSEFEHVLLRSHLERCSDCAAYAAAISGTTQALREARLQSLSRPVALPERRRVLPLRASQAAAAVAAVALAVGLGSLFGSLGAQAPARAPSVVGGGNAASPTSEDALLRGPRLALLNAAKGVGTQRGLGLDV